MKKVGSEETWFKGEKVPWCCGGEGAMVTENGEREGGAPRITHKNIPPKSLVW